MKEIRQERQGLRSEREEEGKVNRKEEEREENLRERERKKIKEKGGKFERQKKQENEGGK